MDAKPKTPAQMRYGEMKIKHKAGAWKASNLAWIMNSGSMQLRRRRSCYYSADAEEEKGTETVGGHIDQSMKSFKTHSISEYNHPI